jgi:hypothetical protein
LASLAAKCTFEVDFDGLPSLHNQLGQKIRHDVRALRLFAGATLGAQHARGPRIPPRKRAPGRMRLVALCLTSQDESEQGQIWPPTGRKVHLCGEFQRPTSSRHGCVIATGRRVSSMAQRQRLIQTRARPVGDPPPKRRAASDETTRVRKEANLTPNWPQSAPLRSISTAFQTSAARLSSQSFTAPGRRPKTRSPQARAPEVPRQNDAQHRSNSTVSCLMSQHARKRSQMPSKKRAHGKWQRPCQSRHCSINSTIVKAGIGLQSSRSATAIIITVQHKP